MTGAAERMCILRHLRLLLGASTTTSAPSARSWATGTTAASPPYCNATFVHKLPTGVGFEAGALTELLACCVHSVIEQAGVTAGDFVAITGPGPVGLFSALVALAEGGDGDSLRH